MVSGFNDAKLKLSSWLADASSFFFFFSYANAEDPQGRESHVTARDFMSFSKSADGDLWR